MPRSVVGQSTHSLWFGGHVVHALRYSLDASPWAIGFASTHVASNTLSIPIYPRKHESEWELIGRAVVIKTCMCTCIPLTFAGISDPLKTSEPGYPSDPGKLVGH